jgi:hypothetical protein
MTGTIATLGEGVTTATPVVVQNEQMCEFVGSEVRSAQKWNCAPKKTIPRSKPVFGFARSCRACVCKDGA